VRVRVRVRVRLRVRVHHRGWAVDLRADAAIGALSPARGHLSQPAVLVSPHGYPVRIPAG
jgi:hypothetical protein